MPVGILVLQGIVMNVRIAIETLRVHRIGYNTVWADKTTKFWVVHPGAHVVQLNVTVVDLPGELPVGGRGRTGRVTGRAPQMVRLHIRRALLRVQRGVAFGGDGGATQANRDYAITD